MGKDKAFLTFKDKTFLRWILEALEKQCNQIIIVGNKEKELYKKQTEGIKTSIEVIKDIYPYQGPLNGIVSALEFIPYKHTFIASCDTPLINHKLIPFFYEKIDNYEAVIPVVKNRYQPLNTLYKTDALYKAKEIFIHGNRSMFSFINRLNLQYIPEEEITNLDKHLYTYWSINTPKDYTDLTKIEI
ncbi:MAG: molybdenum cofactor guanylyltransferase [Aquificae bacterium]|nr:molybdenum cofactor guanylyltransferase [Aquificota bacterium]